MMYLSLLTHTASLFNCKNWWKRSSKEWLSFSSLMRCQTSIRLGGDFMKWNSIYYSNNQNLPCKKYLDYKFYSNQNQLKDKSDVYYFKLPYIGNLSHHIKNKLSKLCKEFCKENFNIKLVFNSFKIKNYFSYKDPIPNDLKFFLVYKFTCASCSSSYICETCHHFKTRIEEHLKKDNKSHIFKHIHSTPTCFDS